MLELNFWAWLIAITAILRLWLVVAVPLALLFCRVCALNRCEDAREDDAT